MTVAAGSDLTAGRGTTEVAHLSFAAEEQLRLVAGSHVTVSTDDDIVAALAAHRPSV